MWVTDFYSLGDEIVPSNIQIYNEDCLPAMRKMKDKQFDLAIVDPPYGGGATQLSEDTSQNMTICGGGRVIEPFLGSRTAAVACYDMGFDLVGYEIDKDYFEAAQKRIENHKKQLVLF